MSRSGLGFLDDLQASWSETVAKYQSAVADFDSAYAELKSYADLAGADSESQATWNNANTTATALASVLADAGDAYSKVTAWFTSQPAADYQLPDINSGGVLAGLRHAPGLGIIAPIIAEAGVWGAIGIIVAATASIAAAVVTVSNANAFFRQRRADAIRRKIQMDNPDWTPAQVDAATNAQVVATEGSSFSSTVANLVKFGVLGVLVYWLVREHDRDRGD